MHLYNGKHWNGSYNPLFPARFEERDYSYEELKEQLEMLEHLLMLQGTDTWLSHCRMIFDSVKKQYDLVTSVVKEKPLSTSHNSQHGITKTLENLLNIYQMNVGKPVIGWGSCSGVFSKWDRTFRELPEEQKRQIDRWNLRMNDFLELVQEQISEFWDKLEPVVKILRSGFFHSEKRQLLAPYRFELPELPIDLEAVITNSRLWRIHETIETRKNVRLCLNHGICILQVRMDYIEQLRAFKDSEHQLLANNLERSWDLLSFGEYQQTIVSESLRWEKDYIRRFWRTKARMREFLEDSVKWGYLDKEIYAL